MGKETGFMQHPRQTPAKRPPAERVNDWQLLQLPLTDLQLQQQATRCMDCGIPFCHTGTTLNGMVSGCPINNLIPEWNDLVYRGLWREAFDRLSKTNNFPEFTGLVCPAPCEAACTLGLTDRPVAVKSLEYAIIDRAFREGWVQPEMARERTGKKVAVIGSGPAGLACADQLNRVGHQVTVFERADRIGGLLTYGIPNMKLDKGIVQRRIDLMAAAGITFVTNADVGQDYPVEALRSDFEAIVLCTGATRPRDLPVEGRGLDGVYFAVDYLRTNTKRLLNGGIQDHGYVTARGKDVIVIGGGDTGTDCVATALRQGCRSLVQLEIMPRPPDSRAPDNPWPQWPRVYALDYGQEEAAACFGCDPRRYCVMTKTILGDGRGAVRAIQTVDIRWQKSSNGSGPSLVEIPGSEREWPAQLVLLAMGFLGPENSLLEKLGVQQSERGNVKAEFGKFTTNVPGIFTAGDARRGQSLVVWAINEGRGAARECDRYLMGATDLP